ncbi:MAG: ECF transporter S component [Lachnospira sp.]|nr:ECF transporter S component [Lachnospira sp.]
MKDRAAKTTDLVTTAMFTAIIIAMAFVPYLGYIPLGFMNATIIHIPVIIGAVLLGPKKGAFLGAVFGLTSMINNTFNPNLTSFVFSPFYSLGDMHGNAASLVICFVPRILVGVVAYYVYVGVSKLIKSKKNGNAAALAVAGAAGSLTNTLLVMNGIYFLFGESYASAKGIAIDALYGVILGVIGTQGVPEAIVAAVLTAAIGKALIHIRNKM